MSGNVERLSKLYFRNNLKFNLFPFAEPTDILYFHINQFYLFFSKGIFLAMAAINWLKKDQYNSII